MSECGMKGMVLKGMLREGWYERDGLRECVPNRSASIVSSAFAVEEVMFCRYLPSACMSVVC